MSFFSIPAAGDGFPLVATRFEPARKPSKVVVIACATGIAQFFYSTFAKYLAQHGYLTFTFDYRYNGLSFNAKSAQYNLLDESDRISELKKHPEVSLHDYGEKDIRGVIEYVVQQYPLKLYYIGHSLGCHALPLAGTATLANIHATMFVSATNPYIGAYTNDRVAQGWKVMEDFVNENGYFDGRPFGFGGLLPAESLKMWKHWASLPHYAADDPSKSHLYHAYTAKVTALGFSDDPQILNSPKTMEMWSTALPNANIELLKVDAAAVMLKLGHNDVFRARNQVLWSTTFLAWLKDRPLKLTSGKGMI